MLEYLALFRFVGTFQFWVKSDKIKGHFRPSAHERFFAAAVKQPQRPIISWLCARTAKETHVLAFCTRSGAVIVCATQALGICSVTTCFTTIL